MTNSYNGEKATTATSEISTISAYSTTGGKNIFVSSNSNSSIVQLGSLNCQSRLHTHLT